MQVAAAPPATRLDYYPQRTQQMGPGTMMGAAPTAVTPYQQTGYQTGYQPPYGYNGSGQDGGDTEQRRGGRRWLPWLIAGLVVLAAVVVALVLLHGSGGGGTFVPQVNGESWTTAEAQIKAEGLVPVEVKQASSSVRSGLVISTSPANGNSIAKGGTVTVDVSTGVSNITLPNLQGVQAGTAETTLKNLGFQNVIPATDTSSTLPSGEVDHTSPGAGSYPPSQQITLYVSGGGVQVPNVVNQTSVVAQSILQQDGFNVSVVSTPAPASEAVAPGTVYNQNPAATTVEPKGTLIQIFVQPETSSSSSPSASSSPTPTGDGGSPTTSPSATPSDSNTDPAGGGVGGFSTQAPDADS
jgi:serine/threonine-protein kinase